MTSVVLPPLQNIELGSPTVCAAPNMTQIQDYGSRRATDHKRDHARARSRSADRNSDDNESDQGGNGQGKHDGDSASDGPSRKRRRSRKGLEKKFDCPTEGCGKSYSRAEHLYRHQLNHQPKQIYRCDFPDCNRTFVRLDLCNRHKDRHTAKGSTLSRRDSMVGQSSPVESARPQLGTTQSSASPETSRPPSGYPKSHKPSFPYQSSRDVNSSPFSPLANTPGPTFPPSAPSNDTEGYSSHDNYSNGHVGPPAHHSPGPRRASMQPSSGAYGVLSPVSTQHGSYHSQPSHTPQPPSAIPFVPTHNFTPFTLPPSGFATTSASASNMSHGPSQNYEPRTSAEAEQSQDQTSSEMMLMDHLGAQPTTIPVFGEGFSNKSPYSSIPDDLVAYLFSTNAPDASPSMGPMMSNPYASYGEYPSQYSVPYYGPDGAPLGFFPPSNQPQQVMSVTNLLDQNLPESILSEEKSQELFDLISSRFHENDYAPVERQRDNMLEGDRSDDHHMLSRRMMQQYIGSYWLHFSDQMPILHKPTFSPDKTPNLLLLAVISIGAACLDRTHSPQVTRAGAQLSNFLAWHLRWEVFMDVNFRPPAKLWIFQTLILLELYEKMYSTRELHERAHIHHATMITLMRRGRSLIGRSALDSPPNPRDDSKSVMNGSRQSSTSGQAHTADEWWNHWITNETTRRTAFAAFLLDSIHATMFGHSTVMVAHEMRLPLPCDDQLWKATSGAEVGRIESNLISNGIKPISFLEGLKRTLGHQEVRTNPFGRQILMAGLLSVSWHMNQRDLQISTLGNGISQALGGRDRWRSTLTRAFDSWKADFDKSLERVEAAADPYSYEKRGESMVVFESRTVLHHLAHMAMHVDIVDCQIFARAKRLLGRAIGSQDLNSAQRRMRDQWAPSAKARDATFYALKFLCSVLLTEETSSPPTDNGSNVSGVLYVARDDVLLNRPWVMYFAALCIWCYGYALEGPCPEVSVPTSSHEKTDQMRAYLQRLGSVSSPEDLKLMRGINHNSALLLVLKDSFASTRWELLHEGALLLGNCIQLNATPVP